MLEWESLDEIGKIKAQALLDELDSIYDSFQRKVQTKMRRFHLERLDDETGISGTGIIVEGVEFSDGSVSLRWMTDLTSWATYRSIEQVKAIHGHGGKTVVRWVDTEDLIR